LLAVGSIGFIVLSERFDAGESERPCVFTAERISEKLADFRLLKDGVDGRWVRAFCVWASRIDGELKSAFQFLSKGEGSTGISVAIGKFPSWAT